MPARSNIAVARKPARGPQRSRRTPEATREALLAAAVAEFAHEGYGGARVDRISRGADSNDRMLYYYFESKELLFRAVIERCYDDLVRAEQALHLDLAAPQAALATLIEFNWTYYWEHPELLSVLASENLFEGRHVRDAIKADFSRAQFTMLERVMRSGMEAKVFRPDADLFLVFMTILSMTYFYRANLHTLSNYLAIDLGETARREMWLAHVQRLVADFVDVGGAPKRQRSPAKSARR